MRPLVRDRLTWQAAKLPVFASCFEAACCVSAQRRPATFEPIEDDDSRLPTCFTIMAGDARERFLFAASIACSRRLLGFLFVGDEFSEVFGHHQRHLLRWSFRLAAQPGDHSDHVRQDSQCQPAVHLPQGLHPLLAHPALGGIIPATLVGLAGEQRATLVDGFFRWRCFAVRW